ncbi:MAG: TIM barrel protein, partial [Caldilineaceae bacterium]
MHIDHIGFSFSVSAGFGALRKFEEGLDHLSRIGYTMIEVNPQPFAIIMDGEIRPQQLANFVSVLRNFDLRYSIHGYNRLNLAYDPRHDLCKRIMACQIEICRAAGADRLVYHSGLQALDDLHRGVRHTPLTEEELITGAAREVTAFQQLAPFAADAGVVIGMENGDSHLWEHTLMTRFGLPREALLKHHARLQITPIVRQLEAIDHPSVG